MECPDPMADYEGYCLWCEMHACTTCDGTGEIDGDEDDFPHTCQTCDGSGVDPSAVESPEFE